MTPDQIGRVVNDPRLTPHAARLILHVGMRGDGEVEIEPAELRILLGCQGDNPVYKARENAVHCGYLKWKRGGNGHHNGYQYVDPMSETLTPEGDCLPEHSPLRVSARPPIGGDGDDAITPIIPLRVLDPRAEEAIEHHERALTGCRDSLRDYLRERVPHERQRAFVQDVAGKLNGLGFSWKGVPSEKWVGLVAAALNELAATDERTEYKRPPGDPRNFRTKLGILVDNEFRGGKPTARASPRDRPSDTQEYIPTETFLGFNG